MLIKYIIVMCLFSRALSTLDFLVVFAVGYVIRFTAIAAGRRFCCCRLLRTDDRGGNPRFDINLSTPLSERCSPSFANAALSTAPLRNVKLLSLSTKVALFSSQVARSWSFNVFRRCISVVRRVVGMTLLSFTDGAADFAVRSRRLTSYRDYDNFRPATI